MYTLLRIHIQWTTKSNGIISTGNGWSGCEPSNLLYPHPLLLSTPHHLLLISCFSCWNPLFGSPSLLWYNLGLIRLLEKLLQSACHDLERLSFEKTTVWPHHRWNKHTASGIQSKTLWGALYAAMVERALICGCSECTCWVRISFVWPFLTPFLFSYLISQCH